MALEGPSEYIAQKVQDALAADERLGELGLQVSLSENHLLVSGVVATEERRRAVGEVVAHTVPGVEVRNGVEVEELREPDHVENLS